MSRDYVAQLDTLSDIDLAWFAGWLCADGSIRMGRGGSPGISFKLIDKEPLDKFSEMFGNGVRGPYKPTGLGKRDTYEWRIAGKKAAAILNHIYHLLTPRYRARADELAAWFKSDERGRALSPNDVAHIKQQLISGGRGIGRRLARQYNVSDALISAIKYGRVHCASM